MEAVADAMPQLSTADVNPDGLMTFEQVTESVKVIARVLWIASA